MCVERISTRSVDRRTAKLLPRLRTFWPPNYSIHGEDHTNSLEFQHTIAIDTEDYPCATEPPSATSFFNQQQIFTTTTRRIILQRDGTAEQQNLDDEIVSLLALAPSACHHDGYSRWRCMFHARGLHVATILRFRKPLLYSTLYGRH